MTTNCTRAGACLLIMAVALALPAVAELQNVQVGGQITILGEYYRNVETTGNGDRWPAPFLPARPIGTLGTGITGFFGWDDRGPAYSLVSHWTRLNVAADFTDGVSAFIEIDALDVWGEDFRSDYVTGADFITPTNDDIEIYQAYIDAAELFGLPLRARIGRQELRFGSEWLVGANDDGPSPAWGLSFDGVRLTYGTDLFSVDAWWSKLADRSPAEEDGDVDFYGLYASYYGDQDVTFDAYWLWLRDGVSINDTDYSWLSEWIEDALRVDDYDVTNTHTVGLRAAGALGAFDFEAEAAYQWGEASIAGALFSPFTYGDDNAEYSEWACNIELGYTFDVRWQPRVHLGFAFFGGEDERDLSFLEWLNPFDRPEASPSFNRLFSNWSHSPILDGSDMSNVHILHMGVVAAPTESVEMGLDAGYYLADEAFNAPVHFVLGSYRIPVAPELSFWTHENDDELGIDLSAYVCYTYSDDLSFEVGWTHLFVGDGLKEGSFSNSNGLDFNGGTGGDDADYFYFETGLEF